MISTIAGTGVAGFSGDGNAATSAQLSSPSGSASDGSGNIYVADKGNHRVRKIAITGVISTLAGTGVAGFSGDGGAATSAQLGSPAGLALDALGNVYVADDGNNRIRKITPTGVISTMAGRETNGFSGDGGLATNAHMYSPMGVVVDGLGMVYAVERANHCVRRIATTGTITTVAGPVDPQGMGPLIKARLADARALVPAEGRWLFAGGASGTIQRLREAEGWLDVVGGRYGGASTATANLARFRAKTFGVVGGIAYDAANHLIYLTESTSNRLHVVTIVDPDDENTWTIADLAGDAILGTEGSANGAAASARFRNPTGLYFDSSGA